MKEEEADTSPLIGRIMVITRFGKVKHLIIKKIKVIKSDSVKTQKRKIKETDEIKNYIKKDQLFVCEGECNKFELHEFNTIFSIIACGFDPDDPTDFYFKIICYDINSNQHCQESISYENMKLMLDGKRKINKWVEII